MCKKLSFDNWSSLMLHWHFSYLSWQKYVYAHLTPVWQCLPVDRVFLVCSIWLPEMWWVQGICVHALVSVKKSHQSSQSRQFWHAIASLSIFYASLNPGGAHTAKQEDWNLATSTLLTQKSIILIPQSILYFAVHLTLKTWQCLFMCAASSTKPHFYFFFFIALTLKSKVMKSSWI